MSQDTYKLRQGFTHGVDESLIVEQLKLSPDQRLAQLVSMYRWSRELALAGARARGKLA
jgi:hypothetical protein